jgi:archaellum component FlaF (FlaF/FlaG flagellin family)
MIYLLAVLVGTKLESSIGHPGLAHLSRQSVHPFLHTSSKELWKVSSSSFMVTCFCLGSKDVSVSQQATVTDTKVPCQGGAALLPSQCLTCGLNTTFGCNSLKISCMSSLML